MTENRVPGGYVYTTAALASPKPPPIADECPAVSYRVTVNRHSDFLTVDATLTHRMSDGSTRDGWMPFEGYSVYISEPCWLFRLFGDTTERRVTRAIRKVARRAEREIARRQRLDAAFKATTT